MRVVPPALLPGTLADAIRGLGLPDSDPRPQPARRTARDWFVDLSCFGLALLFGALFLLGERSEAEVSSTVTSIDIGLGAACCLALWWRRRWPVALALATAAATVLSISAIPASLIMVLTVAVHRRFTSVLPVLAAHMVAAVVVRAWRPSQTNPWWVDMTLSVVILAAIVAWGMFVRARRHLILQLRDRVDRAEAEQRLQAERARLTERARIAREMHDVLAHKISLITLHAGGLEMRPDLPADEVEEVAALVRSTSRQALHELRMIIGVLRDGDGDEPVPQAPQPTLRDVLRLVADSQRAGMRVALDLAVDASEVPDGVGRDAYRIVQEALTNVSKHAPGTAVTVGISGGHEHGLRVEVRNPLPVGSPPAPLPGAGMGLVGLGERVSLSGGTLRHGVIGNDEFEVIAELRWPS